MSALIRVLPDALINKIAAGEVVDRPASVVKELVENSLDAGARDIHVDIRAGGQSLIHVVDDGRGMSPEDARLCLERHATSKISSDADLFSIRTLGFRGEAMAAIAGVSRLELRTRPADQAVGTRIRIDGGEIRGIEEAGGPVGTEVVVRDLFFNTPARLKFLKSATVEGGHIQDVMTRLALGQPGVGFRLTRGNEALLRVSRASGPEDRIWEILGVRVGEQLFPFAAERSGVSVEGVLSSPALSRSGWSGFYLFINGRPLRDRAVMRSVAEAYRGILPKGRYPMVLVYLTLPLGEVDVNVHPGKLEVRLARELLVSELIIHALRQTLARTPWRRRAEAPAPLVLRPPPAPAPSPSPVEILPSSEAPPPTRYTLVREVNPDRYSPMPVEALPPRPSVDVSAEAARDIPPVYRAPAPSAVDAPPRPPHPPAAAPAPVDRVDTRFSSMRIIGQYVPAYVLCQDGGDLVLIDQHAAHERVMGARLARGGSIGQALLVPRVVELGPREASVLAEALGGLRSLGVEVEPFGGRSFAVKALPPALATLEAEPLLREVVRALVADARGPSSREALLASTLAAHGASEAVRPLKAGEMKELVEGLDGTPEGWICPHGRTLLLRLGRRDVERLLKRGGAGGL